MRSAPFRPGRGRGAPVLMEQAVRRLQVLPFTIRNKARSHGQQLCALRCRAWSLKTPTKRDQRDLPIPINTLPFAARACPRCSLAATSRLVIILQRLCQGRCIHGLRSILCLWEIVRTFRIQVRRLLRSTGWCFRCWRGCHVGSLRPGVSPGGPTPVHTYTCVPRSIPHCDG